MELTRMALIVGIVVFPAACDQQAVEVRLREEAGRSGKVGTMVAIQVWQSAIASTKKPPCPVQSANIRIEGRLLEGQRELRRWEEQRRLVVKDDQLSLEIHTTLWNEIELQNTQHTVFALQNGNYRWSAPLSGESFERPEETGDWERLMAYGHGFQSVLEDVPVCMDPVYDANWKTRMGAYGKPTVVRPESGIVEASWQIGTRILELRMENISE